MLDVDTGVGTGGEPELRKLGARGKPTAKGGLPILGPEACGEDGNGDEPSPSTCSKMAYSTGDARDATGSDFFIGSGSGSAINPDP